MPLEFLRRKGGGTPAPKAAAPASGPPPVPEEAVAEEHYKDEFFLFLGRHIGLPVDQAPVTLVMVFPFITDCATRPCCEAPQAGDAAVRP